MIACRGVGRGFGGTLVVGDELAIFELEIDGDDRLRVGVVVVDEGAGVEDRVEEARGARGGEREVKDERDEESASE